MKSFWKAEILEMAESDIFYVKWGAYDDGAVEKWLWLLFVELWVFLSSKLSFQNGLEKPLFTATLGMPMRANGDRDVTKRYLEWSSWSSTSRKEA